MKLIMENSNTGKIKKAPVGFSWTTLFFGPFPALFRGDISWFLIQLVVDGAFYIPRLLFIPALIFPFLYNKNSIKDLLKKGYEVKEIERGTLKEASRLLGISLPQLNCIEKALK